MSIFDYDGTDRGCGSDAQGGGEGDGDIGDYGDGFMGEEGDGDRDGYGGFYFLILREAAP